MNNQKLTRFAVAAGLALTCLGASQASGQSVDALLDKLVDKGILSVKEANDLKAESDKNFTTAYQVKSGMPDWVNALKFNGDFRGRYDWVSFEAPNTIDRHRLRYRLRFGAVATLRDDLEVGLRLTSAEPAKGFASAQTSPGGDPISGNASFSGNGSKKFIYIDQAYARWSPLHTAGWEGNIAFGKMENPFVFSDIVFDPDYTPEGIAAQLSYAIDAKHTVRAAAGGFMLNELSASSDDPFMIAGQFRWDAMWSTKVQSSFGLAALGIQNRESLASASIPNVNVGNTRANQVLGTTTNQVPAFGFYPVVADASLTYVLDRFPGYTGPFPIRMFGDYMHNPGAPTGKNTGWSAGVMYGKSGKKGTWDLSYRYKYLESDAWFEELVDSDTGAFYPSAPFGGASGYGPGTNLRGHVVRLAYSPYDSLTLSCTYYLMQLLNNPTPATSSQAGRMQVDAMVKF